MNKRKILIVGAGPQALFLVREYYRTGFQVTVVGRENEIAMHSRFGLKVLIENEQDLVNKLTSLASQKSKKDCIIASGFYLAFLMNHFSSFFSMFNVFPKDIGALNIFLNKSNTYKLAERIDCSFPKSTLINDINGNDLNSVKFPQIVKWNKDIFLYEKPSFKTRLVTSQQELKSLINELGEREKNALIMQEYLGGDLQKNFSYGAYFDNGKLVAGICVNEVRHFRSGVSSIVEEYTGKYADLITNKAIQLVGETSFTGFLDVEFKIHKEEAYLLEVNPRPFGFIKIMKIKYPNLIPFIHGEYESNTKNPNPVKWMNVLRDCVLIAKNPKKISHMLGILFDFNNRTFDVWDLEDMKPFFYQIKR